MDVTGLGKVMFIYAVLLVVTGAVGITFIRWLLNF